MRDSKQKMRFSDSDLGLMKSLFAEDDSLFYAIRKVMYQFPLDETERELIEKSYNPEVAYILKKTFNPDLDPDSPVHQLTHLGLSLGADIKGLSPEGAWPLLRAKKIEIDYINQQLEIVGKLDKKPKIVLDDLISFEGSTAKAEEEFINVTAWNWLLSFIDSNLQQLKFFAGQKTETVEETKIRLGRDSTQ